MNVLKPGEVIKPELDIKQVELLLKKLYGINKCWIEELQGYDDKNYHIKVSNVPNPISNEYITKANVSQSDFVLKITNALDSRNSNQFDAHKNVMLYLLREGFHVQEPLRNIRGEYHSLETFGSKAHMVRLLTYLEGNLLKSVEITNDLAYKLGVQVAQLSVSLLKFHHSFYTTHKSVWMLSELHQLNSFLYVVQSKERRQIVQGCLEEFERKVIETYDDFDKGVIHGDINEQNILVNIEPDRTPQEQFSILDFGDSQYSYLIFDLAIAITYMIVETRRLDVGAYIMAGYSTIRKLPYKELKVLKTCITARLCQSLVLGLYTFEQDPNNAYVLSTQDYGWSLLETLTKYKSTELINKWTQIMRDLDDYENDNFNVEWTL